MTLVFAIIISMVVSLTVTPMVCAWMPVFRRRNETWLDRTIENALDRIIDLYARSLRPVVDHPWITLVVILLTLGGTVQLYRTIPKGNLPQDDIGLINGSTEAAPDVSFAEMARLQKRATEVLMNDPDVANVGSFIGAPGLTAAANQGRIFVALKPMGQRKATSMEVIARLRPQFAKIAGLSVFMQPSQDLRNGGRSSKAQYQFTLSDASIEELDEWRDKILDKLKKLPQLADVTSDKERGGLRASVVIDRNAASRMNVPIASITAALNSAFGQRQDTIIYSQRNQYRVIFETPPSRQRDIRDLSGIYVSATTGLQVPLTALAHVERGYMPLVVNHQGVMPAITLSYNLAPGATLDGATKAIEAAIEEMTLPAGLHAGFAGDAADFRKVAAGMAVLILAALLSVYIILGILYESLVHPITIISTLPSAGLGALLMLELFGMEFTVIAFIGILLLIGIVKKNGIMLVDFALQAEREQGESVHDAALDAARERFRPILMTTLAALFGALPLAFATGIGAEMRRPLGITIIGGLILSQAMTLYTTPVIYLLMSKLRRLRKGAAKPSDNAVVI
jgi:multidrug efflux pump